MLFLKAGDILLGREPSQFISFLTAKERDVKQLLLRFWNDEQGQDIAEYAVMLAVILVIVIGTVRLIGTSANNVFNQVGSQLNQ
jgi:pilus assembly protein Flp/PilA